MAPLGPFERCPVLAVAVSGGGDSMALAVLARDWAMQRGGSTVALVVDHGLRPESALEAGLTISRLNRQGISGAILKVGHLVRGPALAERARRARYDVLERACQEAGILHLLIGHHAADQAETLAMRALRGSSFAGLAGMAALRETRCIRLLRPLLNTPPALLRSFLLQRGVGWVEDPSNQDQHALRARLRPSLPPSPKALLHAATLAGQVRAKEEARLAGILAERVTIRPEGYARLSPGRIRPEALGALIRCIAGAPYPIAPAALVSLAQDPGPATLAGVRLTATDRNGAGFWVGREEAAIAPAQPAQAGTVWDNRFSLSGSLGNDIMVGKVGNAAAGLRALSPLPAVILRTMPALWRQGDLVAVPHLRYFRDGLEPVDAVFTPPCMLAGPAFRPSTVKD